MAINIQRIERAEPRTRCTACTKPDDRTPVVDVTIEGVGGRSEFVLCEYHRAGMATMLGVFADDALELGNDDDA